jgi:hypothetical protein
LLCQQKPNPITTLHDLELGIPRDTVLAGLAAAGYKLQKEPTPDDDPKLDMWWVLDLSGKSLAGKLWFEKGKLDAASITLYQGGDEPEMVNLLFEAIYDQSGQSSIQEKPGELSRTRQAALVVVSTENTYGSGLRFRTLTFVVGQKQFNLSVNKLSTPVENSPNRRSKIPHPASVGD